MTLYLRRLSAVTICARCKLPTEPWQTNERAWSGSYLWRPGFHPVCAMHECYGDELGARMAENCFLTKMIPRDEFCGRHYLLPVTLSRG